MDNDSKTNLDAELCNEIMEDRRERCEQKLLEIIGKQGVPEEDCFKIANSVLACFKQALNEIHGASLEEEPKTAVDKARMAAGYIALEKIVKNMEAEIDK